MDQGECNKSTQLDNLVTMHDGYKHQYRETVGFTVTDIKWTANRAT